MSKILVFILLFSITAVNGQSIELSPDSLVSKVPIIKLKNINEATGRVLTSDAFGKATWQDIPALWQQTNNYIRNTNTGGFWSPYPTAIPVNADNTTNPPTSPVSGNGTRMAWIPARSAFQGGTFNLPDGSVRFVSNSIGLFSFCFGLNAESRSRGGVAVGEEVIAEGTSNTFAIGESVQVAGNRNASLGFNNQIADGTSNTIQIGENVQSTGGEYNNSFGWGLIASGYGTSQFGTFNTTPAGSLNSWISTDPLLIIGNGQSNAARSNALTIQKNGVMSLGVAPNLSTSFKLRVGGGISASSIIFGSQLKANNLSGTGERDICTDASGNLIVCGNGANAKVYNVSAMGFQAFTNTTAAAASFFRDVPKCLVSFENGTKKDNAYLYAPVELPQGFQVAAMLFHFLQNAGGVMTVRFVSVPKLSNAISTTEISVSSVSGSGIIEKSGSPAATLTIDNDNFYYYLILEAGSSWQGSDMALRGVVFTDTKK